ncbi:MAG: flippase-like domain-containing protein [Candidatus Fermentibacteraceae bacterium]|nr:flippase-like domain-containing protein [Candidatus Fermentibacteraceae bacterium]
MRKTLWSLVFAMAVYTAIVFLADVKAVGDALSSMDLLMIPLFLSLSLANYVLRFLKWHYFLGRVGVSIPLRESFMVFLAGFSMTVSPGKLGELLKCYLIRDRRGIPVSRTSPVVVAERITDLLSMILIAMTGLLMVRHRGALVAVAAGSLLVFAAMVLLLWDRAFHALTGLLCRIRRFRERRDSMVDFQGHCRRLLDPRSLAVSVPLGMLSWSAEAMVLCLVSMSLGIDPALPAGVALLAHSAGTIAGAVSLIPGGLGLTEITIGAILTVSMSGADAAATTIIMRFATLWFAVVLGLLVLGHLGRNRCAGQSAPSAGLSAGS